MKSETSVGMIGTGNFGELLYVLFTGIGEFEVKMASQTKPADREKIFDFQEVANCDVVIPAVPTWATWQVLSDACEVLERTDSLFVSVCSVMVEPAEWLEQSLPKEIEKVVSHPIFGPMSTKSGSDFGGKKWVYANLTGKNELFGGFMERVGNGGIEFVEMQPNKHDEAIARSQAVAFLVGRLGMDLGLEAGEFDTNGFEALLINQAVVESEDGELIRDIFRYNGQARKMMKEVRELIDRYIEESENAEK